MAEFAKGMNIKAIQTKYGELLKIGINLEKIKENPTSKGWFNVIIKRGKESNKPNKTEQSEEHLIKTEDKDLEDDVEKHNYDEEIPF